MEINFQFLSNKVIQDGRDREAIAPFDDAPKKPVPPERKGFKKFFCFQTRKKMDLYLLDLHLIKIYIKEK